MDTDTSSIPAGAARPAHPRRWQTMALWTGAGLAVVFLSNLVLRVQLGHGDAIYQPGPLLTCLGLVLAAVLVRRAPLATLALMLVDYYLVLFITPTGELALAPMLTGAVALGLVAATRSRRVAVPALGITVLVLSTGQLAKPVLGGPVMALSQSQLLVVVLAWLIGDSVRRGREDAEKAASRATEQALAEERLRIAREVHDMVAHSIGVIAIQAGVGSRVIDRQPAQAREALQNIEATSRETLAGLRRTLVALRRSEPASLLPTPGLDELDHLAAATSNDTGLRVDVVWSGRRRPLPQDIELAAFRIVQEALTNVVRHAQAATCRVEIAYGDDDLTLEVTDDGRGSPAEGPGSGFGITGMRERATLLGGRLEAGPHPGTGFRVTAALPLDNTVLAEGEKR